MLGDVTLWQYGLVALTSFLASVVGGIAGYGTGLLLPPVLIPIIGAEAIVPVIGLSALLTNGSRLVAFREHLDIRRAALVSLVALPTTALGAYGYTAVMACWSAAPRARACSCFRCCSRRASRAWR